MQKKGVFILIVSKGVSQGA